GLSLRLDDLDRLATTLVLVVRDGDREPHPVLLVDAVLALLPAALFQGLHGRFGPLTHLVAVTVLVAFLTGEEDDAAQRLGVLLDRLEQLVDDLLPVDDLEERLTSGLVLEDLTVQVQVEVLVG